MEFANVETVSDLIEYLQGQDPDARVYDIDGMSIVAPEEGRPPDPQAPVGSGPGGG